MPSIKLESAPKIPVTMKRIRFELKCFRANITKLTKNAGFVGVLS
jgi:hypothetical protein